MSGQRVESKGNGEEKGRGERREKGEERKLVEINRREWIKKECVERREKRR